MLPRVLQSSIPPLLLIFLVGLSSAEPVPIDSVANLRKLDNESNCYVVAYFKNQNSIEAENYKAAVSEIEFSKGMTYCDGLVFGITSDEGVKEELGIEGNQGIVEIEGGRSVFTGKFEVREIRRWIEDAPIPLVSYFHTKIVRHFFDAKEYLMLFASRTSADFPALKNAFTAAAKQFRLKTRYVVVDTDDEANREYMSTFVGFREDQSPALYGVTLGVHGWEKFLPDFTEITTESIVAYNERLLSGDLKRNLKSEEIPEDWDAKPVKVLVGKNFHEVIKGSGKSAFVFFTSPWSPYCKVVEPIWEALGDHFADSEDVLIAKINTAHGTNEIEGLHINGEPTLMFFSRGTKDVVEYNGERTVEDLVNFANEQVEKEEKKERIEL